MAGKYRMTINGFTCHNETWDDPWQKDGKRDELFFAVNTKIVGRDGTVKRQLSSESDVMGDTNGQPGRIQAGSASDRGGIRTGDRFPDKDRPWEHGDALDGHRYPPYVIWEGDLSDGGDVVLLTPTLWEFDPGGSVIEGWVAWQVETDKTFGQRAKDIVSGKWPITASVFDAVSLGIQTFGSLFGQWGPLGSQGSRPIGLQPDPADPKGVLFNPTIVALSAETAEHLANANDQGLGRGILELVFKDHKDLGGDYSVYLQIETLTQQAPAPAVGAVGDPFAYSTPFDDTARVIAREDNGSILELFYLTGAGWRSANLSALSGAPAALGDPHAYVVPDDQAARLVYRGVDGHVHGLDYQARRGWAHAGLSARVGAPAATSNPFGYLTPFDGLSRVVYRDGNGHMHELYAQSGQSWGYADLSAVTGAPPAAGDPVAYITPSDGFARVVYRD